MRWRQVANLSYEEEDRKRTHRVALAFRLLRWVEAFDGVFPIDLPGDEAAAASAQEQTASDPDENIAAECVMERIKQDETEGDDADNR